jgi:hypothetical protein
VSYVVRHAEGPCTGPCALGCCAQGPGAQPCGWCCACLRGCRAVTALGRRPVVDTPGPDGDRFEVVRSEPGRVLTLADLLDALGADPVADEIERADGPALYCAGCGERLFEDDDEHDRQCDWRPWGD